MRPGVRIAARPLDDARFARYGTVIRRPSSAGRTAFDGVLGCAHPDGRLRASMSRLDPEPLPKAFPRMERHPHAVQLFLPMAGTCYLAVTALGADAPDLTTLDAFLVPCDVGIAYGIGVWHVPMTVLADPATFLVLMHRVSPELDEDWHTLREPIEVADADGPGAQLNAERRE